MPAVSFAEAARRLGHRSRSTLYRLKADCRLEPYLVQGPDGSQLVELTPEEKPSLEAYLSAILDPGRGRRPERGMGRRPSDRRWELVAATLSKALAEIRGPALTAKEAELLAERMGPATWDVFPEGLPNGPPETPPHPQGDGTTILDHLWNPLAKEANQQLVANGWRLPRLSGQEFLLVYAAAGDWMEGTTWDTESLAWWRATVEEAEEVAGDPTHPKDPHQDPWRCEGCGKPWHPSHPDYERTPELVAYVEDLQAWCASGGKWLSSGEAAHLINAHLIAEREAEAPQGPGDKGPSAGPSLRVNPQRP
jgi:hypothetical protein